MIEPDLDRRPTVIAVAGSNGAGKSTFVETQLASLPFPFVNADVIAQQLGLHPYKAAEAAETLRQKHVRNRESFIFETVFSDPAGAKVEFLRETVNEDFNVILCFIAIRNSTISHQRVGMRVSQGGHDVPPEKLDSRYERTLENLKRAITVLPRVYVYDNSDLSNPYYHAATFRDSKATTGYFMLTEWLAGLLGPEFYES